MPAKISM